MTSARGDQSMLRDINMKTGPAMSALPPKADMCSATRHVRFVPIADIAHLFDHLVGSDLHSRRHSEAERFCGLEIDG